MLATEVQSTWRRRRWKTTRGSTTSSRTWRNWQRRRDKSTSTNWDRWQSDRRMSRSTWPLKNSRSLRNKKKNHLNNNLRCTCLKNKEKIKRKKQCKITDPTLNSSKRLKMRRSETWRRKYNDASNKFMTPSKWLLKLILKFKEEIKKKMRNLLQSSILLRGRSNRMN